MLEHWWCDAIRRARDGSWCYNRDWFDGMFVADYRAVQESGSDKDQIQMLKSVAVDVAQDVESVVTGVSDQHGEGLEEFDALLMSSRTRI